MCCVHDVRKAREAGEREGTRSGDACGMSGSRLSPRPSPAERSNGLVRGVFMGDLIYNLNHWGYRVGCDGVALEADGNMSKIVR